MSLWVCCITLGCLAADLTYMSIYVPQIHCLPFSSSALSGGLTFVGALVNCLGLEQNGEEPGYSPIPSMFMCQSLAARVFSTAPSLPDSLPQFQLPSGGRWSQQAPVKLSPPFGFQASNMWWAVSKTAPSDVHCYGLNCVPSKKRYTKFLTLWR